MDFNRKEMRKLIIFLTIWPLLLFGQQNDCTFKLSNEVQSESLKNTFDPNGKRIRNSPYTMFNRVDYKLDSKEDIQNYLDVVRKKILKGQPNLNEVDFTNEEAHYFYSIWITAHDATKSQPWKKTQMTIIMQIM